MLTGQLLKMVPSVFRSIQYLRMNAVSRGHDDPRMNECSSTNVLKSFGIVSQLKRHKPRPVIHLYGTSSITRFCLCLWAFLPHLLRDPAKTKTEINLKL